jgi:diaminopropionate ammonia-lyase
MSSPVQSQAREVYMNAVAQSTVGTLTAPATAARAFHERLPDYTRTPLRQAPALAEHLDVKRVLIKDESSRLGLPAFKVLGAAWSTYRALANYVGDPHGEMPLETVRERIQESPNLTLLAATVGNHGRAVARFAAFFGCRARIYVPAHVARARIDLIEAEGAECVIVDGVYEDAAKVERHDAGPDALVITDVGWPEYQQVPAWTIDGYGTIFSEVDDQLAELNDGGIDVVFSPVGAGGLLASALRHYRQPSGPIARVVGVEPLDAAGMLASLRAGQRSSVPGPFRSIMNGCNCSEPSIIGWETARNALDCAVAVGDDAARAAIQALGREGFAVGDTGGAALAGALELFGGSDGAAIREGLSVTKDSTLLFLCTEGPTKPTT